MAQQFRVPGVLVKDQNSVLRKLLGWFTTSWHFSSNVLFWNLQAPPHMYTFTHTERHMHTEIQFKRHLKKLKHAKNETKTKQKQPTEWEPCYVNSYISVVCTRKIFAKPQIPSFFSTLKARKESMFLNYILLLVCMWEVGEGGSCLPVKVYP